MGPAIQAENVSKRYLISRAGAAGAGRSLREDLVRAASVPLAWLRGGRAGNVREELWALRDVSFRIETGEVVGVIGRNGAGKSTLLKILSRVTRPSEGRLVLEGRLGCLLEVGVGFNPELTGRDNIYLNGAILGMTRKETARKFGTIVDFAELEKFIDTPVKRYSSGMLIRLGFSIAAHLEPDILILDEVLAVGDVAFQAKCRDKIASLVREEHRTVVLVSHDPAALSALCERALLFHAGRLAYAGDVDKALKLYKNAAELELNDQGRLLFASLDWSGGGVEPGPDAAATRAPVCLRRAYRVRGARAAGELCISYYAAREPRLGGAEEIFLGTELLDPGGKAVGPHEGTSPPLYVGRAGDWHIIAVLECEGNILPTDGQGHVAVSTGRLRVTGPLNLAIDDGRPGYSESGAGWIDANHRGGYGGKYRSCPAGRGEAGATWAFRGLAAGQYEVFVTWYPWQNRATKVTYRVYADDQLRAAVSVNQQWEPAGEEFQGVVFQSLGLVRTAGENLTVAVSNEADGWVIADAARLVERDQ